MNPNTKNGNVSTESNLVSASKYYVETNQWLVFPLRINQKKPAVPTGLKAATKDLAKIQEWWGKGTPYNIGITTGGRTNIVVIDLDEKNGVSGSQSLEKLEREYGLLPQTLTVNTASGGTHKYFRLAEGSTARNRAAVRPGIDVRGEGGYVVAPPSVIDGNSYSWVDPDVPVAELPNWLFQIITGTTAPDNASKTTATLIEQGSRNDQLFRFVMKQMRLGTPRDRMVELADNANISMCRPPLDAVEVQQIVDNAFRLYAERLQIRLSDIGNANKLAELHGDKVRYVFDQKCWLLWNGAYWEPAPDEKIIALAKDVPSSLAKEAAELPNGPTKKLLATFALRSESLAKIKAMVELFKSEDRIGVSTIELDRHGFVLPVQNGTVNLQNGIFAPPERDLLVTQVAGTVYDPTALAPRWEQFMLQIMGGDAELVTYLQRAIGYVLTASTEEQCLFFLYGFGANGKSTFLNIVLALMGALGTQAASETLMDKRTGGGTSSDLARLRGKRFVAMSESDDGRHLNEAQVKHLTGGDSVVARELYQSVIHFTPSHKLFLASNHQPVIKSTDHGIWRRIRLIPFKVTIKLEDRNSNLEKELRQELPGILNWALKGCFEWQKYGMPIPKAVREATEEYREEMDLVGAWIAENCTVSPFNEVSAAEAYQSFDPWCKENYNISFSKNRFGRLLRERGFEPGMKSGRIYKGLSLKNSLSNIIKNSLSSEKF